MFGHLARGSLAEACASRSLGDILERMNELDTAEELVLQCKSGVRSAKALHTLRDAGFRKMKNLKGGVLAWAREVDTSLPTY